MGFINDPLNHQHIKIMEVKMNTISTKQPEKITAGQSVISLAETVLNKSSALRSLVSTRLEEICLIDPEVEEASLRANCGLPKYFQVLTEILQNIERQIDSIAATINRVDL